MYYFFSSYLYKGVVKFESQQSFKMTLQKYNIIYKICLSTVTLLSFYVTKMCFSAFYPFLRTIMSYAIDRKKLSSSQHDLLLSIIITLHTECKNIVSEYRFDYRRITLFTRWLPSDIVSTRMSTPLPSTTLRPLRSKY